MKKLQNLKGAKALNKKEQQSINGGDSAWIKCDDGTNHEAPSCATFFIEHFCAARGGLDICAGGGNNQ